jgi:hypothetical protein
MYITENLQEKWQPVLEHPDLPKIGDAYKRAVTTVILENQEKAVREDRSFMTEAAPANSTGASVDNWDPVLISLVRRAMPNLIAYDVCGVQPMTGPTGLIFAMKSKYKTGTEREALFNEAETRYSGDSAGTHDSDNASGLSGLTDTGAVSADSTIDDERLTALAAGGMSVTDAEGLGSTGAGPASAFNEMGFTIEKATVTATTRALKAEYSLELAQDLKAVHGLDAESELANILSTEILAEINREVIRTINSQAKTGADQAGIAVNGIFNLATDADGRWSAEKYKGLVIQIDRDANKIARETRRGKGNVVICSSDVATALSASGSLDYAYGQTQQLQVDDTGNTYAGTINGRIKVYIDPYASTDYITVGFKGSNPYDAGVFYCPYVPLQMVRAIGENDFQPRIGFKTRYGMASNPFVGATPSNGLAAVKTNQYYRIFRVDNILS